MQRYIEQLLDDLREITRNMPSPLALWEQVNTESESDPENDAGADQDAEQDLSYVEEYIYGNMKPMSQITGIETSQLPPEEKLNTQQMALLSTELEQFLQYFHFYLDFPSGYPAHLRYHFIRRFWDEEHVPLPCGESHIEFCDYDPEQCPFPGFCNLCREFSGEIEFSEGHNGSVFIDMDPDDELLNGSLN